MTSHRQTPPPPTRIGRPGGHGGAGYLIAVAFLVTVGAFVLVGVLI